MATLKIWIVLLSFTFPSAFSNSKVDQPSRKSGQSQLSKNEELIILDDDISASPIFSDLTPIDRQRSGPGVSSRKSSSAVAPPRVAASRAASTVSCEARSSCSNPSVLNSRRPLHFAERNCFCNDRCWLFDDCCEDKIEEDKGEEVWARQLKVNIRCERFKERINSDIEVYLVRECPKSTPTETFVRIHCEDDIETGAEARMASFYTVPVTGARSGILYKNYYCAYCSGEPEVIFWNTEVRCPTSPFNSSYPLSESDGRERRRALLEILSGGGGTRGRYPPSKGIGSGCSVEYVHPTPGVEARQCKSHMNRCLKSWRGSKEVKQKCQESGNTNYVYAGLLVFKNRFCAQCNDVNFTYVSCVDTRTPIPNDTSQTAAPPAPFSIIIDLNGSRGQLTESGRKGQEEPSVVMVNLQGCPDNPAVERQLFDPFEGVCRVLRCQYGFAFDEKGNCLTRSAGENETVEYIGGASGSTSPAPSPSSKKTPLTKGRTNAASRTERTRYQEPQLPVAEEVGDKLKCALEYVESSGYERLHNGSVYVFKSSRVYDMGEYSIDEGGSGNLTVCAQTLTDLNETASELMDPAILLMFQYDTYLQRATNFVTVLVATGALSMFLVIYLLLPSLRRTNLGKSLLNLAIALLSAELLYLLSIGRTDEPIACYVLAVAMHYFFLVAIFWTDVLALCHFRTSNSSDLRNDEGRNHERKIFLLLYSPYAWISPALIVAVSLLLDRAELGDEAYRPRYAREVCWLTHRQALLFLFALPLAVVFAINLLLSLITASVLMYRNRVRRRGSLGTSSLTTSTRGSEEDKDERVTRFILHVVLSLIMTLTWVVAFLAALNSSPEGIHVLWYVFISLNAFQALFLCVAFACTRRVYDLLQERFRRSYSSSPDGNYSSANNRRYNPYQKQSRRPPRPGYTARSYFFDGKAKVISVETSI